MAIVIYISELKTKASFDVYATSSEVSSAQTISLYLRLIYFYIWLLINETPSPSWVVEVSEKIKLGGILEIGPS